MKRSAEEQSGISAEQGQEQEGQQPSKKVKLDHVPAPQVSGQDGAESDVPQLSMFKVEKILNHSEATKYLACVGSFEGREGQALVQLSRQGLPSEVEELQQLISASAEQQLTFHNDIYYKLSSAVPSRLNVEYVCPAAGRHVQKHTKQSYVTIQETPELYEKVTKPVIDGQDVSKIQWVYNILESKAEQDRVIFNDKDEATGFILIPDLKWNQEQVSSLYCQALCHRRDIRSVRDLRKEHIPLLRNIVDQGVAALTSKYGVKRGDLRIFVHYLPTYYHLHVHFSHMQSDPNSGVAIGRARPLGEVIDCLEKYGDSYFKEATLEITVGEKIQQQYTAQAAQPEMGPAQ